MPSQRLVRRQRRAWARALTVAPACVFALGMGLSRVYLGHHWLTDVLGAWTIGLAWLVVVITAHSLFITGDDVRGSGPGHSCADDGGRAAAVVGAS